MVNLYIDESGSMTTKYNKNNPYFLICIIKPINNRRLKTLYKRFVSKHLNELRQIDLQTENKMFVEEEFKELKGSELTQELKKEFINYFCRENCLEIFYIILNNKKIDRNLYENTARAFNYTLKITLSFLIRNGYLPKDQYIIQIDERNEKTKTKYFLEEYLNTELILHEQLLDKNLTVNYFDSCNNHLIQIADVFANIYFSELITKKYTKELKNIEKQGYIKNIFNFPKK